MTRIEEINKEIEILNEKAARLANGERAYQRGMNEDGDGFNPFETDIEKVDEKIMELLDERERLEWTYEVTLERKLAWNDWVRSQPGPTMDPKALMAYQEEIGYGRETLGRNIKRHGLSTKR